MAPELSAARGQTYAFGSTFGDEQRSIVSCACDLPCDLERKSRESLSTRPRET
jgi:hypothetical protein